VNLYLVRHGETAYNRDGLGLGREDVPLTSLGLAQAEAVGRRLSRVPLRRILSSPLVRARTVADAISWETGVPVEIRDGLIELDVGETEGMTFAAMREKYPEFLDRWGGPEGHLAVMPGGESLADVDARLAPLLEEVLAAPDTGDVALVSHNFVLRLALCRLLGLEIAAFRSVAMDLASISTLAVNGNRIAVVALNEACHARISITET
jgi:phosphoserine phosphatase